MSRSALILAVLACGTIHNADAGEVSGKIIIDKSLNKKTLMPAVYNLRGMAIREGPPEHPVANEFERIAVWLESKEPAGAMTPMDTTMAQRDRRFEPSLLIVPVGSTVEFPNTDPIFHNIFSLSRAQSFDLGYYPKGQSRTVRFTHAGIVQVYCHVHSNMYGVIVVVSSSWFEKPDQNGNFSWSAIPPGKYELVVWQKTLGLIRKNIVVREKGALHLDISLPDEDPET
jgi:plastocyanin